MRTKLILLLAFIATGIYSAFGQCSDGPDIFSSQADVDNFAVNYPACKWLTNPIISGANITNLNGLKKVERVFGSLQIYGNTNLTNLEGLKNMYFIGGGIEIYNNPALTNLDGLSSMININGSLKVNNNAVLADIMGLQKIRGIAGLTVTNNPQLRVCNLPNFCTYLSNGANPRTISGNLANCLNEAAVATACSVGCPTGNIAFYSQADVDAFGATYAHCTNINLGDVTVNGPDITNLDAFSNIKRINGNFLIVNNPVLASIQGLNNLHILGGALLLATNPSLTNIDGLEDVTNIGEVFILGNASLTNLNGLSNFFSVGTNISIANNPSLTDISGLLNLNTNTITGTAGLSIIENAKLAVCDLPNICDYLSDPDKPRTIRDNLANCLDEAAVTAACTNACPRWSVSFYSQLDLDRFGEKYAHCTNITLGSVKIYGSDIHDLSALSNVIKIDGNFEIQPYTTITNLNGLQNLTSITGNVDITQADSLSDLSALQNLTSIGGSLTIFYNSILTNLNGLNGLTSIGGALTIQHNPLLTSLDGLSSLTRINGALSIIENALLTNIGGIKNIDPATISGDGIQIYNNQQLASCALSNFCVYLSDVANPRNISNNQGDCVESSIAAACVCPAGDYFFQSQAEIDQFGLTYGHCGDISLGNLLLVGADITNANGLSRLTSVENFDIYATGLTSPVGLDNLAEVRGYLWIDRNSDLSNLDGLNHITRLGSYLYVSDNPQLTNLNGLRGLTSLGGSLKIESNSLLTDIAALKDIDPGTIIGTGLGITNNPALSICNLPNFCTYLSNLPASHPRSISGNLGGCETMDALTEACETPLAITLVHFSAANRDRVNLLEWRTSGEDPGDIFEIEHSTNGKVFLKIGSIGANGIAHSRYTFSHENPPAVVNYYRLRFANSDGSTAYSKIVAVRRKAGDFVVSASPNPFTGVVRVSVGKINGKATLTVIDIVGKVLKTEPMVENTHTLSLPHLSSGIYFLRYSDDVNTETIKVVK